MNEWINTRDCVPLVEGEYLVQTVFGGVKAMRFTPEGGWNTYYAEGEVKGKPLNAYVARWYKVETPPPVPDEWLEEYMERG